jgi:hypothetical protein
VLSLMIRCPHTGQPISTGIETDEYSLKQIADVPSRTRCPICGLDHTWWKREAWLGDATSARFGAMDSRVVPVASLVSSSATT